METTTDLINVPKLKNIIKNEIERNVSDNMHALNSKLRKLEDAELNCNVEIYGISDSQLHHKKIRQHYVKKICALLSLDSKLIVLSEYKKNFIRVKLTDAVTAREWQTRSCRTRLKNYDLGVNFDGPVKIFVAASHEHKQLLKKTRDLLLSHYKYVSLCKNGVMVRHSDNSKIYVVQKENDIYELLIKAKTTPTQQQNTCFDGVDNDFANLNIANDNIIDFKTFDIDNKPNDQHLI
ncbi:Fp25K [Ectropis obliqua nucleopolyhedrovirus]|uniref:FP protein n=1 Tax=Ectropis obliqua nucleopolyhedrovirus TaxID=59376 RepID=A0EYU8_9ABAC|nr:Fp25K [Ectropis obliqua nucleopolyhedrovirus]ABI35728.1 Fp25K [Ectropis obliqua nucleopolyhedrovirus]AGS47902.1 FP protein [Ectropis obliqua nucleopolyhedrovirus]QWV59686.1 Fp25K [Ectropis obliqua nucleopolyhedrovirus]UYO72843.1 Fp25K [Ectropis obliqua nucleopolyhedrovirus]